MTWSCHHGLRRIVLDPRQRRVPVVDHVVVVEDHRARHDREHPALDLRRPRLVVQPGVLLEVGDVVEPRDSGRRRRGGHAAARPSPGSAARSRRRTPGRRRTAAGAATRRAAGRACAARGRTARRRRGPARRGRTRATTAARAGRRRGTSRTGSAAARRRACGSRSAGTATSAAASTARRRGAPRTGSSSRARGPRRSRARSGGQHTLNVGVRCPSTSTVHGCVGLHPDRGRRVGDVAQQRTEHQTSHRRTYPASCRSSPSSEVHAVSPADAPRCQYGPSPWTSSATSAPSKIGSRRSSPRSTQRRGRRSRGRQVGRSPTSCPTAPATARSGRPSTHSAIWAASGAVGGSEAARMGPGRPGRCAAGGRRRAPGNARVTALADSQRDTTNAERSTEMATKIKGDLQRWPGGAVRVSMPAKVANDLDTFKKGVAAFAERLGCPECFSGSIARSRANATSSSTTISTCGHGGSCRASSVPWRDKREVTIALTPSTEYDLEAILTKIDIWGKRLGPHWLQGGLAMCCSGFDMTFERELHATLDVDGNFAPSSAQHRFDPPQLGVGITFSSGIESILDRHPELIDVVEIEPQTTWLRCRTAGRVEPSRGRRLLSRDFRSEAGAQHRGSSRRNDRPRSGADRAAARHDRRTRVAMGERASQLQPDRSVPHGLLPATSSDRPRE